MATRNILMLPNELLLQIGNWLGYESEINSFSQTCRHLYSLLCPLLYQTNVRTGDGCALHWAAHRGYDTTARKALEAGADPCAVVSHRKLPLVIAVDYGHLSVVKVFKEYGMSGTGDADWMDKAGGGWLRKDLLRSAVALRYEDLVRWFLEEEEGFLEELREPGPEPDCTPLMEAAAGGSLVMAKLLVEAGCDIEARDRNNYTALAHAARWNNAEMVKYLVEAGADMETESEIGRTPLVHVAESEDPDPAALKYLLDHGANPNPRVREVNQVVPLFPLAAAVRWKAHEKTMLLLRHRDWAETVATDWERMVLLIAATACGDVELLRKLLSKGWDAQTIPTYSWTYGGGSLISPLWWAVESGRVEIVKLLLAHGVDPNSGPSGESRIDQSPIHCAVISKNEEIISILLEHGAQPNIRPGPTSLEMGIAIQSQVMFQYLLDRGLEMTDEEARHEYFSEVFTAVVQDGIPAQVEEVVNRAEILVQDHGEGLLPLVVSYRDINMLNTLIRLGFDPKPGRYGEKYDKDVFMQTLLGGQLEIIQLLFSLGYTLPRLEHADALQKAAEHGAKHLDLLLDHGMHIDELDSAGRTALFLASATHKTKAVFLLIHRGADIFFEIPGQGGPLTNAAKHGRADSVKTFLDSFSSRNIPLQEIEPEIRRAERIATSTGRRYILRILRQWYWPKRYPVPS